MLHLDAQMKTLIDRTVSRYIEISNKEMYFIMTAADRKSRQWKELGKYRCKP
jgi:hypothetical protein